MKALLYFTIGATLAVVAVLFLMVISAPPPPRVLY